MHFDYHSQRQAAYATNEFHRGSEQLCHCADI